MAKLKTETNTRTMERRIRSAAAQILRKRNLQYDFEHGQWWVTHVPTGAQWSVVDASGGRSVRGFDFEQVTAGAEP